ncbi:Uncharacterised protein [Candidatus Ornithobacterium hominis]|uniref:glycosyltransferase n=1 Tax=Candidatus Ornithobacterium hominis TaxID=2497989 RepID=UPI000E5AC918|nr:glycosyltransferase [Candidatus Ornithobacterium hominis]SZD72073.1 Uncharacterised protein [Candidatus Ornithobacterium hominis]
MKVLLLGEYSGVHKNLKEGLTYLGHDVIVASSGDGFRNIERDIDLTKNKNLGVFKDIHYFSKLIALSQRIRNYDVVQLMHPGIFPIKYKINYRILKHLKKNNHKIFMLGAGGTQLNSKLADFYKKYFKYKEIYRAINPENKELWSEGIEGRKFNNFLLDILDGYIPLMYEYAEPYRREKYDKLKPTIPIPINLEKITYTDNIIQNKLNIFHGKSRADKGTPLIEKVLNKLQQKYPNEINVMMVGGLPYNEYLKVLDSANVVIDQLYSASYGVNAIINMAKGKIVMGGGEKECIQEFGLTSSPMIPLEPTEESIEKAVFHLIENRKNIIEMGMESRKYVEDIHDHIKVAKKYVDVWQQ